MALSNWDTLAFDTEGKPCSGIMEIPSGASVRIYKNWLFVDCPKMWRKDCGFSKYVIANIDHGDISLAGFEIHAVRSKLQSSIFCFASHVEYIGKGKKKYEQHQDYYFAGIGAYGFMDDLVWLKNNHRRIYNRIDPKYLNEKKYCRSTYHCFGGKQKEEWGMEFYGDKGHFRLRLNIKKPDINEMWLGVTQETFNAFMKWLKTVAPEKYFVKIDPSKALRYNQGDAFFAGSLNIDLPSTPVGEAKGTIMGGMFKGKK